MTATDLLAQLTTTREADQRTRLTDLLARATNAARRGLFIAAACAFPVLVVTVGRGARA